MNKGIIKGFFKFLKQKIFSVKSVDYSRSPTYKALGQFGYYQIAIEEQAPDRVLFLAIPDEIYLDLESDPIFLKAKKRYDLKLIAYNIENQKITTWDK